MKRPLLAALAAVFLGAVDLTVIATVLPAMVIDLGINTADVDRYVWVVNAYMLAYIVAIPVMGRVSDLVGRRAAFELSLLVFSVGSLWCALANDLPSLVAARAVQGAGGGALLPVAMALVGDLLPPGRRLGAIGLVGAIDTLGWVLGPIWGAAIVGIFSTQEQAWRWIFWINLPLAAAILVAIRRTTSSDSGDARSLLLRLKRLDVVGILLLLTGMTLLTLGLSAGGELGSAAGQGLRAFGGTPNPLAAHVGTLIASGAVILMVFGWWETRARWPAVPMQLFRHRRFAAAVVGNGLVGAALIVTMVDVPVVVALLVSPDRISSVSASLLAPFTVTMAVFALGGSFLASYFGIRAITVGGLVAVIVGYAVIWAGLRDQNYLGMIPGLFIAGMGFGAVIAPLGAVVIDEAPERDRGIAAGLTIVARLLGMTIGISALTAIGVRRLQDLTGSAEPLDQRAGESTADFLLRQNAFIQEVAVPLSIRVVRETFLVAACIALIALIPVWLMSSRRRS